MPWIWVARTLGSQVAKRVVKKRSKKWAGKQVQRRGGKLYPPAPLGPGIPKYESKRSGGQSSQRLRARSRKSMRGASAPRRTRKPKFVGYRKGGCPPGYVYDVKRKMCIHKSYR